MCISSKTSMIKLQCIINIYNCTTKSKIPSNEIQIFTSGHNTIFCNSLYFLLSCFYFYLFYFFYSFVVVIVVVVVVVVCILLLLLFSWFFFFMSKNTKSVSNLAINALISLMPRLNINSIELT
jgi:hypothetical protein